jgi:hypothetical protein
LYYDINYKIELPFFEKLNLIGTDVRKNEIKRDFKYDIIVLVNCKTYSIESIESDWFTNNFAKIDTNAKDIYVDVVSHMLFPPDCKLSYNLMCMESIPFNIISNFNRFYKKMNKHLNSNSIENVLYIYTHMCKLKLYNLSNNIMVKFRKRLI